MTRDAIGPNVVLIVLDTARMDAFETYGARAGSSPTVAQLASSGCAYSRAVSTSNWTLPSHVSMFSGLLPRTAGLPFLPHGERSYCRSVIHGHRDRWLPEILRREGYHTSGASTNGWVSSGLGFNQGFEEFHDMVGGRNHQILDPRLRARARWYAQALAARVDDGLSGVESLVRRWAAQAKRPFFWFVNLVECHSPYLPPRPYNDLPWFERVRAAGDARRYQTLMAIWRCCSTGIMPSDESMARMRHLYQHSIRMMDDWLARLCEDLDRRGLLDDTLLVVTSDHGENFGEGDLFGHVLSLDDRLLSVPLVFTGPGTRRDPGCLTSLARLPAMIAQSVGIDPSRWIGDQSNSDVAVAQHDVDIEVGDPRLKILEDWGATTEGIRRFTEPMTAATDGRYKLVTLGAEERFYDLESDPLELNAGPSVEAPAAIVERLRQSIENSKRNEWIPDVNALRRSSEAREDVDAVKDLEDRMRLLGYL